MMRLTKGVESSSSDDGLVAKDVLRKIVEEKEKKLLGEPVQKKPKKEKPFPICLTRGCAPYVELQRLRLTPSKKLKLQRQR